MPSLLRVGFTEELRPLCAATPPRLALSGALVLNAGSEHKPHCLQREDCLQAAELHGAQRRISQDEKALS
ncbi:hypothetical protein NQZ68_027331 [Dissostichus eleginoides]|nr:hypothetical protein NQZ68_027331 [Dissostichus eleginoides]